VSDIQLNALDTGEELFQLKNGRYFLSQEHSEKMFYIKEARPEQTYKPDGFEYTWNEGGMADLFSECYKNETRYCSEKKSWYTYLDGAWRKDIESHYVSRKIREFCNLMVMYCGEIEDDGVKQEYLKFVNKMGDRRFRDRLMRDAADNENMVIRAEEFDSNPYLINCLNGTYDLEKMEFREHDWHDFLTMQTNFKYTLQDSRCERWEQFISEVTCGDADKAEYLQKALGYSMLGMANEECMFILHGKTTRNGKSTMLAAIEHLLGDYSTNAPVKIICRNGVKKDAETPSPVLAGLKGKRFVTMSESEDSGKLDESVIKQLTGGESITARNLYESAIRYVPQFTLWLSCNDLPTVRDKSLFASDRVRVIEFNRHFKEEEQDKNLKNEFQTQEAMQGIFSWLVAGYFKYKRFGLKMSDDMKKVVRQYEKDNDLILQFLEQKCEKTLDGSTRAKSLYDAYKIWCKSNGYFVCSAKAFYAGINQHPDWYANRRTLDGYPVYDGLRLKQ